ncbi:MAG: hypothetical protein D6785_14645 [Planctomycetota bacterium]|nr:MAG: hypothetical protein D6785_14645 [Planctomycetota bacterium]
MVMKTKGFLWIFFTLVFLWVPLHQMNIVSGKEKVDQKKSSPSKMIQDSLNRALEWLKRHQSPKGYWTSSRFDQFCSRSPRCSNKYPAPKDSIQERIDPQNIGQGMNGYDAGVTGLAVLAFLGSGHTHKAGKFRLQVKKALEWIKSIQVVNPSSKWYGSIGYIINGKKTSQPEWIYSHCICTLALCQAYAITKDYQLKDYAQRAVDFLVKCQNPGLGWRYDDTNPARVIKSGKNDTSVTGWAIMALKAAKRGRLKVPYRSFKGAKKWFRRVTGSKGQVGYMTPGGGSSVLYGRQNSFDELPTNTAISVKSRLLLGEYKMKRDIQKGANILMKNLPKWEKRTINMYYWYYGTHAIFQIRGRKWDCRKKILILPNERKRKVSCCWYHAILQALLPFQRQEGKKSCGDGSWDPVSEWGIAGGRVYSTALCALTLEICARYERMKSR